MALHRIFASIALIFFFGTAIVSDLSPALAEDASQTITKAAAIPPWMQPLKLTAAQMQQMNAIQDKHQAKILQDTQKLSRAQQELEQLLVSGAPDDQLRQKYRQVQIQKYRLDNTRFEVTLELQDVLSSQQRQMLAELNKKRLASLRSQINNSNVEE